MIDVMLDLETWGQRPGAALRSIGAVFFDLDGNLGQEFYINVDEQSCLDAGLHKDPDTVAWWAKQSKAAQDALLVDPLNLADALAGFAMFYRSGRPKRIWSQGGNFDEPLICAAFRAVGQKAPWNFWESRDTRTAYDLFGLDPRTIKRAGTYHNALDDAKHQVACVAAAVRLGQAKGAFA